MSKIKKVKDELWKNQIRAERISSKLLAWGTLLERQSECDGFRELAGLATTLLGFSRVLYKMSHSLDLIQIDLEKPARKRAKYE